jgi:hypothetical protein
MNALNHERAGRPRSGKTYLAVIALRTAIGRPMRLNPSMPCPVPSTWMVP